MIFFIFLTVALTVFYYKINQCTYFYEVFICFLMSIVTQFVLVIAIDFIVDMYLAYLVY